MSRYTEEIRQRHQSLEHVLHSTGGLVNLVRLSGRELVDCVARRLSQRGLYIDEQIDDPDHVILANPVLQTLGKERGLIAMNSLDETRHPAPSIFVEV